nr:penicillin acylase family protein [Spirosomataceae bacterium]
TAETLIGLLKSRWQTPVSDGNLLKAKDLLFNWNHQLAPESIAATIYTTWESQLKRALYQQFVPKNIQPYFRTLPTKRLTDWLITPRPDMGSDPVKARDELLFQTLHASLDTITKRLGADMAQWQYGQPKNKHITLKHALNDWVDDAQRARINLGPLPRGGYGETVNNTGGNLNQEHGASFRILIDTEDWDKTLGINSPGQSANPDDPHYRDLFELWAKNDYFPVYFSKDKIKVVADQVYQLRPKP